MTIKECIDIVDNNKPNQYTIKDKVSWLSFIEEIIINDVLKTHEGYDGRYDTFTGYTEDKISVRLIVPSPYDRLYTEYLKMMIDKENGETARYNNSAASFNTYMSEYKKYYNKHHMPLGIRGENRKNTPPNINAGLSDAEEENIKKGIINVLTEKLHNMVSADKLADIVNKYVQNNIQMLKGRDGYTPKKGVDYFIPDDFKDIGMERKADKDLSNVDDNVFKAKAKRAGVGGGGITENEVEEMLRMFADTVVSVKADKHDVYTKLEHEESVGRVINGIVFPAIAKKAENDLSNVSNEAFLTKLNAVLPDGDGVSY